VPEKKKGQSRGPRPPSAPARRLRRIYRQNIAYLIDKQYPLKKFRIRSEQQIQLAKDAGTSFSTVQRIFEEARGLSVDVLADLAAAFEVKAADLLNDRFMDTQQLPSPEGTALEDPLRRKSS